MTTGKSMGRESKLLAGAFLAALVAYPVLHLAGAADRNAAPGASPQQAASVPDGTRRVRQAKPDPGALSRSAYAKDFSRFFHANREGEPLGPIHLKVNKALLALAETPEAAPERVRVDGSRVNLRAGPDLSAERITAFDRDTRLTVLERGETWTQVENPETGQTGWMHGDYLKTVTKSSPDSTAHAGAAQEKAGT